MKKLLLSVTLLALSCTSLAEPSTRAANLAALNLGEALCYDATVQLNKKTDVAKERAAETQIAAALKGLGLRATEFDAADVCDRVLLFDFNMDNIGSPMIYKSSLSVESLVAVDSDVDINVATVWEVLYWGGDRTQISTAEASQLFNRKLTDALGHFKEDYRSLKAATSAGPST